MKAKLENIWYYYKNIIIFGGIIAAVLLVSVVQCVKEPKPDFSILCAYTGYNDFSQLEEKAADIAGDINGDGKSVVLCENLSMTGDDASENDRIVKERIMLSFAAGENTLYIMDKVFFEPKYYGDGFEDLSPLLPEESLEGGVTLDGKIIAIPAENCPLLKSSGINCKDLYIGIPWATDALKKQKNSDALFDTSRKLLREFAKPDPDAD